MEAGAADAKQYDELIRFITAFIKADQRYSGYTYETELRLKRIIRKLGLHSEISATPNSLEIAFWKDDAESQTVRLIVTKDSAWNLDKVTQINAVLEKVIDGKLSFAQGLELLKKIESAPSLYNRPINAFAFILCGLGFAVIIGASWLDVLFGGLLSLLSLGLVLLASRVVRVAIIIEFLAAALAGFIATAITLLLPGLNPIAITISAVVWFIPGFGLTIAPREIIYRNTLPGIIYLTEALLVAVKLFAGALIGIAIGTNLLQLQAQELLPSVNPIWAWAFVPMLCIGLAILFKVAPKNLALILVGSWFVWLGVQVGNMYGSWQGTFLGAVILAVFAALTTSRLRIPSATAFLPLIMVLVPGYAFLEALYILRVEGITEGFIAIFNVIIIIVAIIAGIFVGESIVSTDFAKIIHRSPLRSSKKWRGKQKDT